MVSREPMYKPSSGLCASFISEQLAPCLSLHCRPIAVCVSGIGGLSHKPPLQSITTYEVQSLSEEEMKLDKSL